MNVEEIFGGNAGKVWQALSTGAMGVSDISKKSKLKASDVMGGLGWLAREGKIVIEMQGKNEVYRLVG